MLPQMILKHKALIAIITLAFILRIFDIEGNPKSMYGDELTLVYDAYAILKTGQDQNGEVLPVYFSMGGGRPAGYIYSTIPFVALFGPTALAARATSVLSGIGVVILLYLITSRLLSKKIGIYAAFLAAITPWELSLSRGGFESHFALFLALLGFYFFHKAASKTIWYLASAASFALSMQTYSTYVLTVPLFAAGLFLKEVSFNLKKIFSNWILIFFIIIISASLLFSISISVSRGTKDRFANLSIFNQPDLQNMLANRIVHERLVSPLKSELALAVHNRVLENSALWFGNYLRHFSLEFLFLQGDMNPRHNPASFGALYLFMLPLIVLGAISLYFQKKGVLQLISFWLLIAPLASSLVGDPHALRSSFMLPPLIILAAQGMEKVLKMPKLRMLLLIVFILQLPFFAYRFYLLSAHLHSGFWSYAAKSASELAMQNRKNFDHIILSTSIDDLEFAYPVYAKIEPKEVIDQRTNKTYLGEHSFLKFDNVYLGSIPSGRIRQIMNNLDGSVLYLGVEENSGMIDNEKAQKDQDGSLLFLISTKGSGRLK